MRAGRQPALLVGAAVHDKVQLRRAQSVEIQQRAAFGGSAVGRNRVTGAAQVGDAGVQSGLQLLHARREALVVGQAT